MDLVDVSQDTFLMDHHALNADLIVLNVIMSPFVHNAMMDSLIFTKEVADAQMDFGMMERSVKNVEIIVNNV